MHWRFYNKELPEDGERIISFSWKLHDIYGDGIITDEFNKEVWDSKTDKQKCDLWLPDEELFQILPERN